MENRTFSRFWLEILILVKCAILTKKVIFSEIVVKSPKNWFWMKWDINSLGKTKQILLFSARGGKSLFPQKYFSGNLKIMIPHFFPYLVGREMENSTKIMKWAEKGGIHQ